MNQLGIDIGSSCIKIAYLENKSVTRLLECEHLGRPAKTLKELLEKMDIAEPCTVAITGTQSNWLCKQFPEKIKIEEVPAIIAGGKKLCKCFESIIELGSHCSFFISDINSIPQFSANGHCAGGTGSFFVDQMTRLGMSIKEYSKFATRANTIPRISGRCSVFAKTDIVHLQQEGVPTEDILLGLCYAMIRNFKASIVRKLPVKKPVLFCGGVTRNAGVIQAIRSVFELDEEELIVPDNAEYVSAIGAAVQANITIEISKLISILNTTKNDNYPVLPPLKNCEDYFLPEPQTNGKIPTNGCCLGIDIGSTSTNLVIIDENENLVDFQYLRTAGNPDKAVRNGLMSIQNRFGQIQFQAVGVTGSGRCRIGKMIGADAIIDEITAQAWGAIKQIPNVDTVFEIGGQDSKFIRIKEGKVTTFQMNKICAAGTGSFIEEQSIRSDIPLTEFGKLAMSAKTPIDLNQRCTVFMETAIADASANGIDKGDLAAGLCYSVVKNYLQKTVGNNPIGNNIVLQGGIAYNPAIIAAFNELCEKHVQVNPYFPISGAYGVAILAKQSIPNISAHAEKMNSSYHKNNKAHNAEIEHNKSFFRKADELLKEGYTGNIDPNKKTVGVPYVLAIHKLFPMVNAYFTSLGFNVLLSNPTNEETIALSQSLASGETCFPVKLIYGHMKQLVDAKVDYIFLPSIHSMKHEKSHLPHNYGCVYMQTAPRLIGKSLNLEQNGIKLLNPLFDLDFGRKAMVSAMIGLGKELGIPKPFCFKALLSGAKAVRKHTAAVENMGKKLIDSVKPDEKVLVLITRNYGVSDPVLNMGIPELLLERGHKVITLSHLPAHNLDISKDHPNLYWPFGQHILSGAKIIAHHPNLYAIYLTNHGCGPDTMLTHLFKEEMGTKPYLQIEVDEHFSKVGIITRIEAFLNSLDLRQNETLPENFNLEDVAIRTINQSEQAQKENTIFLPNAGIYGEILASHYRNQGWKIELLPEINEQTLSLGRTFTQSKEYLPFVALIGLTAQHAHIIQNRQLLIPQTEGAEADGQYARVIAGKLMGNKIVSPKIETLWKTLSDPEDFLRAIILGDLLFNAPQEQQNKALTKTTWDISWEGIKRTACKIAEVPTQGKKIGIVGTPMCVVLLNDGIVEQLKHERYTVISAPIAEYLLMLWLESGCPNELISNWISHIEGIGHLLKNRSCFTTNFKQLEKTADTLLPRFNGGNGRYRCAKTVELSNNCQAVLNLAPRYENTDTVLQMSELPSNCNCPVYSIELDHDFDDNAQSQLKSFLHYC